MAKKMKNKKESSNKEYVQRDISWMYFNRRILQEAEREDVPLLERMSFLGIYSNNLDEFFRVRVALLNRIAECDDKEARTERHDAVQTLKVINRLNAKYAKEYERAVTAVEGALSAEGLCIINESHLDDEQREFVRRYYYQHLDGYIAPVWFAAVKDLNSEPDDCIYLAIKMRKTSDPSHPEYALLQLPVGLLGRFVLLPRKDNADYIMYLDDVVRESLPLIFAGLNYNYFEAYAFKFTKDAEMELDNDLRTGLMQKISKGVKSRKKGQALRVIYDAAMPRDVLKRVLGKLKVDKLDTILAAGRYQNHRDFMSFPDCGRSDLKYSRLVPLIKPELLGEGSLLESVRRCDRAIHVPYHDFAAYIRLLQEAAIHKEVRTIKTTLYRVARDSKVVKALINAAQNGKQVTVVIELLARFDEASNINWSKKMQDVGIHVIFGVEGLKVHSKITHIGLRKGADIAAISTGNFHEGNARVYTDYILMTANRNIVRDVAQVFDFIERPYLPVKYKELLVSPNEMQHKFVRMINEEIKNHNQGRPAYIRIKINHITDPVMVKKLYEASANGVPVDLIVRGNCSLVTGIPGLSDNIRIVGIIDRYLEHARIFWFCAGGEDKLFIGSADWMPRNLYNRIEVVTPVYNPEVKEDLKRVIEYGLHDTSQGRIVDGTGRNCFIPVAEGTPRFRSQTALYEAYAEEVARRLAAPTDPAPACVLPPGTLAPALPATPANEAEPSAAETPTPVE